MAHEKAQLEEEKNYDKIFFTMEEKFDMLFAEYENIIKHEKKELGDHASLNHEGGGEQPPPCPSSSESYSYFSSLHSRRHHRNPSKKTFSKLEVKFDLPLFSGESNAEKLDI